MRTVDLIHNQKKYSYSYSICFALNDLIPGENMRVWQKKIYIYFLPNIISLCDFNFLSSLTYYFALRIESYRESIFRDDKPWKKNVQMVPDINLAFKSRQKYGNILKTTLVITYAFIYDSLSSLVSLVFLYQMFN